MLPLITRLLAVTLLLTLTCPASFAAGTHNPNPQFQGQRNSVHPTELESRAQKARREERARQIKRDSAKLLEVATELKQYVDRTGEDVLSLEVVRKAEMMEKLARDLKTRMKGE